MLTITFEIIRMQTIFMVQIKLLRSANKPQCNVKTKDYIPMTAFWKHMWNTSITTTTTVVEGQVIKC